MLVRLVGWFWLLGVVVAASTDANYTETSVEGNGEVKPEDAAGKYHKHHHHSRGRHHSRERDDYDDHYGSYGYGNSYYPQQPYYLPPPLRDQYVCDLDASVLLAVDGHSYGYNKAIRVRCADVTNDADSCNVCCLNSARKDTSITNDQIKSFLVLVDNHKKHHKKDKDEKSKEEDKDESEKMKRRKRSADYGYGSGYYSRDRHRPLKVKSVPWKADDYYNNVKCVCCAPKRDVVVPIVGQSPPTSPYVQPVPLVQTVQAPAFNTQPSWSSQPQQATGSVWPQPASTVQQRQAADGSWNSDMPKPPAPPVAQSQVTWDKTAPQQPAAAAATSSQATWTH
ncbi:hypothetical protein WR25_22873 isoform A [Diploscapter pachys]|uniref:Uncharacterized protein n=1 Tax=Diploscapter pachys TaxID=2018661 RepID=A0A2A2L394_9BILA|nr:hypothetical protein WR25_22873 isoform A [Diploscapter pachys]